MNLVSLFLKQLEGANAQKTALALIKIDGSLEQYSWEEYQEKAICIAKWLKRKDIKKGDFVAILPLNLPESFFAMLGIILIGAIPVPINIQLLKENGLIDLRKIIDDCKPKLTLINESLVNESLDKYMLGINFYVIEGIIKASKRFLSDFYQATEAKGDDLLIMPYTSGTSGQPKGVMLTHKNIINRLEAISTALAATEHEKILSYLPLGHIAELITTFFGQIYNGYTVYFTKNFSAVLRQVQSTIFLAVPKIWMSFREKIETQIKNLPIPGWVIPQWLKRRIIINKLGFNQTKVFVSAGAKISDEDSRFFANLGISIDDIYGLTETAGPLLLNGTVIGSANVSVRNNEIVVGGDCVMTGYYQKSELNYKVFNGSDSRELVFHTGDTGIERDGKIFWTGRVGNGFKWANGEYASPDKIELLEEEIKKIDPRINEAIIYGVNRQYSIALVFSENYTDKKFQEKLRRELPKIGEGMYKIRGFTFINSAELELTPTMKIKRNVMLEKLASVIDSLYK